MRIGLDSNILVYLAGTAKVPADKPKIERTRVVVGSLAESATIVAPAQALGELFVVMCRSGMPKVEARRTILEYAEGLIVPASSQTTMAMALDLAVDHQLQLWDALILCAAAEAGCELLLSEDMQNGFVARGVTIANPLAQTLHPKLKAVLAPN